MMPRRFLLSLLLASFLLAVLVSSEGTARVLSKKHDQNRGHKAIEEELRQQEQDDEEQTPTDEEEEDDGDEDDGDDDDDEHVESFTCTLTGATGKDTCDAAKDDDGSGCVWCILNSVGFCCNEQQAQIFKQAIPTIDCDDSDSTDDKTPPSPDDDKAPGPLWECLESKDEADCGKNSCIWCNTKGNFGVCLTKEAADMASDSYWFDCKADDEDEDEDQNDDDADGGGEEEEDVYDDDAPQDEEETNDGDGATDDDNSDGDEEEESEQAASRDGNDQDDGDEEDEDGDYEDGDEEGSEDEDDDMHEFVVDTSCVLSGMLLDPDDEEATSEAACFQARDISGNPCEWCAVAGSPFRLCLSEPQAQVAEYVGAVCSGSDESFEPEEFDDSCIAHMHNDRQLTRQGCWKHMDLDGNGCEWCNIMGVELCLGGVQAELVEHWGATCVMDDAEHKMAQEAIQQHQEYIQAQKEAKRIERTAQGIPEEEIQEEQDDMDIASLWLTSDPSCMVTTLRTSSGDDSELACAQTQDAQGNPCNWCEMGTSFNMCLNEEQAEVAEYMGIDCETISTDAQQLLKEHAARSQEYQDGEGHEGDEEGDIGDFDPSCILAMQNGLDKDACVATKDVDGTACEWCAWNSFQVCLTDEQADLVKPFGVTCDQETPEQQQKSETDVQEDKAVQEDFWNCIQHTSSGIDACASTKSNTCTWCNTQAGVGVCLSYEAVAAVNEHEFFDCVIAPGINTEEQPAAMNPQDGPKIDTACLVDAGRFGSEEKCESSKDSTTGKPCEWCQLGSLGVNACLSAEQANYAHPLGVTCKGKEAAKVPDGEPAPLLQALPDDFWPCLSQSTSVDDCDESCTWCDLKGSTTGTGLCLSDSVADAVGYIAGDSILDCTEPDDEGEGDGDEEPVEQTTARVMPEVVEEAVDPSVVV